MRFIVAPTFFALFIPTNYNAFAFYPFVVLRKTELRNNQTLLRHEKIHLQQQQELLILPFYLLYLFEFFIHFATVWNWHQAYRKISFEKEAYAFEKEEDYLNRRKLWAMWRSF
jgi:hypothetical protein